jgi:hypothetical protein
MVGEAIGRNVTAAHWPRQGPTDEHLTEIVANIRAWHVIERDGSLSQPATPEGTPVSNTPAAK